VSELLWQTVPTPFTQAGDSLRVPLPPGLAAGDTVAVTVFYEGRPERHGPLWAGLLLRDRENGEPAVGNVNQPHSSHSWFPCKDHPADKATLTMSITAPDDLTVAAVGRLIGVDDLGGGRRTWRWRSDHPVAPYLVGIAASDFDSWSEDCDGVLLDFHAFGEHRERAEVAFGPTCEMLLWLEDLIGPYPFADEKYAQAEMVWGGAMENQTITAYGQAAISLPDSVAHLVTVHELAHHWFGNSLTPGVWRDIWLNEGFARYVELLWREHDRGRASYYRYLQRLRPDDLFVGDGLLGDPDPLITGLIYDKGAWVLHMLRLHLGDPAFFGFLHTYATNPDLVYGHTDRETMIAVASEAAGEDLSTFFAPWLDTEAVPELVAHWQGKRVEVVQLQGEPFFPLTVPVRVHAGEEVVEHLLRLDAVTTAFTVTTTADIDWVVVDPDLLLLRRTTSTIAPGILAAQPRPNPAILSTHLDYWLTDAEQVTATVFDARGRLISREDLGPQPRNADSEPHLWSWHGRDDAGRRAPAGVYWLELRTTQDRTVRKVTLLR